MANEPQLHIFGEVLFDHFPDGNRILGGAPFNVAWHLQALGEAPLFISRIGDDQQGHEIVALIDDWGMSIETLQIDREHPTGSVQVHIQDGEPHYDIVADRAYDFIDGQALKGKVTQGILYHGSLAVRNPVALAALKAVKAGHQGKIFVDVNLRPPWWRRETLLPLLHDADWVKLNEAELTELCPNQAGLENAIQEFCAQFDLEALVVTRGAQGALACDKLFRITNAPPSPKTEVVDTVGAGDAFAAILLLGMTRCWPLGTTLERAQEFACALVGRRGATVADRAFYRPFREKWHFRL